MVRRSASLPIALAAALVTVAAALVTVAAALDAQTVARPIFNDAPRVDVGGDTIDVHDGRVIRFGETYYWYGTAYGATTGFTRANEYRVYSSPDMRAWTPHGAILPDAPSGIYYRPHVIYDDANDRYVLWYNWYPKLWDGHFGVATSDSPLGPFAIEDDDVAVAHSALGVGDFNLFVDDDGAGYLMYNTIEGHRLSVERLADDYLSSAGDNGGFIAEGCEAGSIFRRDSLYYLLTDYTCCFCTEGSGARVYTASSPLDSFAYRQNVNRQPGTAAPELTDGDTRPTAYRAVERRADGTFPDLQISFPRDGAVAALRLLQYTGERAGVCGDTTAERTHDPRVAPGFSVSARQGGAWTDYAGGSVVHAQTALANELRVTTTADAIDAVRLRFDTAYPYDVIRVVEVAVDLADGSTPRAAAGYHGYVLDVPPGTAPPIVPAQQTFVMPLATAGGTEYLWMGDLWGSAIDNVKGHDLQYWSSPLEFYANGLIRPLRWEGRWQLPELE